MRIWTLHPKYLDPQGLVALWRESLLAQKVLRGETKGYRHHPQLHRFQIHPDPIGCVALYLQGIVDEADRRGYRFDKSKIVPSHFQGQLEESRGQLMYEWAHLGGKLMHRSPLWRIYWEGVTSPDSHPLFRIIPGEVRNWEIRPE